MTGRLYPSLCRIFLFLAVFDTASWINPGFLLPAALISAVLQELFWLLLWNRADKRLLIIGFALTEGLALFLLRETEVCPTLLLAGTAYPCTYLFYHRTMPELRPEANVPVPPEKKDLLRLIVPAVFLTMLLYRFFTGEVTKLSVLPVLFLSLLEIARVLYGRHAIRLTGCVSLLLLVLALLPIPEKPIDWSFVERMAQSVEDRIRTIQMDISYYMAGLSDGEGTTGYSGLGRISDQVGTERRPELLLSDRNVSAQLYLTGARFWKYEGDHWTGKEETGDLSWTTGFLDALYREGVTREEAACFSELRDEHITYAYLRTKDRMLPLTTAEIRDPAGQRNNGFRKGDAYDVRYLDVDFGSPMLQGIIRNAASSAQTERASSARAEASLPELSAYAKELYHASLTLTPEEDASTLSRYLDQTGITERMRTLAGEIAEQAKTPYDRALLTEQFLRQFSYRRATETGDDIDRFLFDSGEGYCVHFATAMVLLLRAEGIPARYIEGYLGKFTEKDENGQYIVSSADAHAWVEAYIEGFGWVPMEPTPVVAATAAESSWNRTPVTEEEREKQIFVPPVPVLDRSAGTETGSEPPEEDHNGYLFVLLVVIGFFAAFLLFAVALRFAVSRIAYQRLSDREKAVAGFLALRKKYLAVTRCENKNQPMRTTLRNIEKMTDGVDSETLLTFWYEVRYGDRTEVDPAALKELARIRRQLRRSSRSVLSAESEND